MFLEGLKENREGKSPLTKPAKSKTKQEITHHKKM